MLQTIDRSSFGQTTYLSYQVLIYKY